jgi:Secretion system C-terminal sorting domain/SprB repeat
MKKNLLLLLSLIMVTFCTKTYAALVTFQVDMSLQTVSPLGVHLAGNFQNWDPAGTLMTSAGNGIYTKTIDIPNGPIEYKFINGNDWPQSENVPGACNQGGNRFATISGPLTLPLVCFGQCITCPTATYTVTFEVDMSQQTVSPLGVHIAGNFQNWTPNSTPMTNMGNGIWSKTVSGVFGTVEYKFINGNDWPVSENVPAACASGFNRYYDVQSNGTVPLVCFGECSVCPAGAPLTIAQTAISNVKCNGGNDGSVTVAASGGSGCTMSYSWSNGQSAATATNLAAGSYTVTATCGAQSINYTATIAEPTALIFASSVTTNAACGSAGTAAVTTSGGTGNKTYIWSGGQTTANISAPAGTYGVTATDANNCKINTSLTIGSSAALPSATITSTNPTLTCTTPTTQLNATGVSPSGSAVNYSWSGPGIVTGGNTASPTVNKAGTYIVTVADANNCANTASVTVTDNKTAPSVSIQGSNTLCTGDTLTLIANNTFNNYNWSNNATTNSIKVSAIGTYTLTVTGANGCIGTATKTLSAAPAPIVSVPTDTLSCSKNNVVLNVTTSSTLTSTIWSGPNNYASTVLKPTIQQTGVYTLIATNNQGCSKTFTTTIYQSANTPKVNITGVAAICQGASTTLTATPNAGTYLWSNGNTSNTINVNIPGNYIVTVTDPTGCKILAAANVTTSPNPQVKADDVKACEGQVAILKSTSTGSGVTFVWNNAGTFNATTQNVTLSNVKSSDAGIYYVTAKTALGCIGKDTMTLTIGAGPKVTAADVKACEGSTAELKATAVSTSAVLYTWSNNNGFLGNTQNYPITNATPANNGFYYVAAKNANGCTGRDTLLLSISPKTTIAMSNVLDCDNNATITANVSGGTAPFIYNWSNGGNSGTTVVKAPATVTLTVTDAMSCKTTNNTAYQVVANAPFSVSGKVKNASDLPGSITLTVVNGSAPYTYLWSNGATTKDISTIQAGKYCITVTDAKNCKTENCFTISSGVATNDAYLSSLVQLFPNPTNGLLRLEIKDNTTLLQNISMFDYTGKWLNNYLPVSQTIDLQQLNAGIYFIKVSDETNTAVFKILKI